MANFDGNYGKLCLKIMANFDWKLWQTLIENYGKL
jgi:hypothetical protein